METTKTSNFTCHSKSFISIFFTCQVSACELQPFSCHDLANDIHSQTAKTVLSHVKAPALFNLINNNRKEKSLRLVTMVAKLLDLNKAWSCKYIRTKKTKQKRKNLACMTPVHDCTQEQNGNPKFLSMARQRQWPSLSWQIVEIQKSCYHGNVTSQFSSLWSTASVINWWKNI